MRDLIKVTLLHGADHTVMVHTEINEDQHFLRLVVARLSRSHPPMLPTDHYGVRTLEFELPNQGASDLAGEIHKTAFAKVGGLPKDQITFEKVAEVIQPVLPMEWIWCVKSYAPDTLCEQLPTQLFD